MYDKFVIGIYLRRNVDVQYMEGDRLSSRLIICCYFMGECACVFYVLIVILGFNRLFHKLHYIENSFDNITVEALSWLCR